MKNKTSKYAEFDAISADTFTTALTQIARDEYNVYCEFVRQAIWHQSEFDDAWCEFLAIMAEKGAYDAKSATTTTGDVIYECEHTTREKQQEKQTKFLSQYNSEWWRYNVWRICNTQFRQPTDSRYARKYRDAYHQTTIESDVNDEFWQSTITDDDDVNYNGGISYATLTAQTLQLALKFPDQRKARIWAIRWLNIDGYENESVPVPYKTIVANTGIPRSTCHNIVQEVHEFIQREYPRVFNVNYPSINSN